VRSGPEEGRTILLLHMISVRPSKQPLMVRTFLKEYMELGSYFWFLQEPIKTSSSRDRRTVRSWRALPSVRSLLIRNPYPVTLGIFSWSLVLTKSSMSLLFHHPRAFQTRSYHAQGDLISISSLTFDLAPFRHDIISRLLRPPAFEQGSS